jgi:hypothetical protein
MIDSGLWKDSFYKDEIGWRSWSPRQPGVAHTARRRAIARRISPELRRGRGARPLRPALGLPPPLSGHLSWQYWHGQRRLSGSLSPSATTRSICEPLHGALATIDNHWHLDNEERGRITRSTCGSLGTLWRAASPGTSFERVAIAQSRKPALRGFRE